MRRIRAAVLLAGLVALTIAACEKGPRVGAATQATQSAAAPALSRSDQLILAAATIGLPPAGVQPADLPDPENRGGHLTAKYCAQCHALPAPSTHSATDWPSVARRMWLRMEWLPESLAVQVPTSAERYEILKYLTANALKVSGSVLPAGKGRETFSLVCSRCHALPDPRVHSKEDWPTVYARMERNMERMKVKAPRAEQAQEILLYLRSTGAPKRPARAGK
jgi:cytochrome c5